MFRRSGSCTIRGRLLRHTTLPGTWRRWGGRPRRSLSTPEAVASTTPSDWPRTTAWTQRWVQCDIKQCRLTDESLDINLVFLLSVGKSRERVINDRFCVGPSKLQHLSTNSSVGNLEPRAAGSEPLPRGPYICILRQKRCVGFSSTFCS